MTKSVNLFILQVSILYTMKHFVFFLYIAHAENEFAVFYDISKQNGADKKIHVL